MIVPENRVAMALRDKEESMNSTIIRSLLCPKSATVSKSIFFIVGQMGGAAERVCRLGKKMSGHKS